MFSYDNNGNPLSVWYNGSKYLYQTNLQGDVVGILNQSGTKVATYTYDTYGNLLNTPSAGIGTLNPLRYRGYVYDMDTGWYYLQSWYYDAETGRFLNADEPTMLLMNQGNLLQYNLFAYCGNNPVMYSDSTGHFGTPIQWVMATIGAIAGWYFGDYIARKFGYAPSGKGFWNAATY